MDSPATGDSSNGPQATETHRTVAAATSLTMKLQVRCPQCRQPIKVDTESAFNEITCGSCGSTFSLVTEDDRRGDQSTPEFVGHFELLEKIGAGAFGSVWKAFDAQLDRTVAVKIPRHGQLDPLREEQFLREARAAAQLRHPHIVQIYEIGRHDDTLFIVSEYVEGVDLSQWLESHQPSFREAAQMGRELAMALEHAHSAGVIHRDLKPSNVLVDVNGQTHLMDFGLAKREAGEVTMTVDGHILGTPTHMSPEQARGEAHQTDHRTDIYSLGVMLFQLLTGDLPFQGNAKMLLYHVLNTDPPAPRRLNAKIPRDLETICLKCMEKLPAARFATAKHVADELDRFLDGRPIQVRPIGRAERARRWSHRNPALAAVSGLALVLLMAGSASVCWQWLRAERSLVEVRQQQDRATRNLRAAQDAVDELLTDVADEMRDLPQTEAIRKRILNRAAVINQRFLQDEAIDRTTAGIDTIRAWRRAAEIALHLNDTAAAESALHTLIGLCEATSMSDRSVEFIAEHASALCKLSSLADLRDDWQESTRLLLTGLEMLEEAPADALKIHPWRAEILRNLGINSERQGELDQAGQYYRQAVDILEALGSSPDDDTRLLISRARIHNSYAIHCKQTRRLDEALDHFNQTQQALVILRRRYPDSAEYQAMVAQNQYNLGNLEFAAKRYDQARSRYLEAKNDFKQLAESFPRIVRYRVMWCHCLRAAALASKQPDQLRSRIVMLKKVAFLREEILRENPELTDNAVQLAKTYRNLGKDHALAEDYEAARHCYRRSIACGPVANASAAVQQKDRLDDAWACSLLANLEMKLSNWDRAREWFEQAIKTRQSLPLDVIQMEDQMRDEASLAVAMVRMGNVEQGLEIIQQLPASSAQAPASDWIAAKAMLDVAQWLDDPSSHSGTATSAPRALRLDAIDRLQSAWQFGYKKVKQYALGELNEVLGEIPEFRELVDQMTAE